MLSDILHKIRAQRDHEPTGHLDRPDLGRHHHACAGDAAAGRVHERPFGDQIGKRQFPCVRRRRAAWAHAPNWRASWHRPVVHDVARFAAPLAHPAHRTHQAEPRQRVPHCVLTDGMQKSYVAHHGAEAHGDPSVFAHVRPQRGDVVHISGNALMNESSLAVNAFILQPRMPARRA